MSTATIHSTNNTPPTPLQTFEGTFPESYKRFENPIAGFDVDVSIKSRAGEEFKDYSLIFVTERIESTEERKTTREEVLTLKNQEIGRLRIEDGSEVKRVTFVWNTNSYNIAFPSNGRFSKIIANLAPEREIQFSVISTEAGQASLTFFRLPKSDDNVDEKGHKTSICQLFRGSRELGEKTCITGKGSAIMLKLC